MNARNIVVFTLILLAMIGLGTSLLGNPLGLAKRLLVTAAVIGIIYFAYRRWFSGRRTENSNEQRAFLKAAKQSKKRHKKQSPSKTRVSNVSKKRATRKKSNAKLTVIEGKKNKKNNRASF
ncbi:SA1362 family protein [Bacillus sp. BHET2]|uniref:SA1362 family protein n=1 Tax=Bacillus sp. BHET2 TaxID=2583818 RepID=UPI001F0F8F4B|nr:SA1362 family protein [Bacillus sp. BHET2]